MESHSLPIGGACCLVPEPTLPDLLGEVNLPKVCTAELHQGRESGPEYVDWIGCIEGQDLRDDELCANCGKYKWEHP